MVKMVVKMVVKMTPLHLVQAAAQISMICLMVTLELH